MNTPAHTYIRRSVVSCIVPVLLIPPLFVLLAGVAGQYPFTARAVVNSFLTIYWVAAICVFVAWVLVVLPAMLWVPPDASVWRVGPAILGGSAVGLFSMVLIGGVPVLSGAPLIDAFFLVAPFLAVGGGVGYLAHLNMTPRS